jgi:hypothetical protein
LSPLRGLVVPLEQESFGMVILAAASARPSPPTSPKTAAAILGSPAASGTPIAPSIDTPQYLTGPRAPM